MEEEQSNRGILSHFSGIIRFIVFIAILALLAFFIIRFARHRQATQKAEQAAQTAQTEKKSTDEGTDKKPEESSSDKASPDNTNNTAEDTNSDKSTDQNTGTNNANTNQIPSGIADNNSTPQTNVPNTGIGENVLLTAVILSVVAYLVVKNTSYSKLLGK